MSDLVRESKNQDLTPIYNPDSEDFKFQYDSKPYILHAGEIERFPKQITDHAKKHLTNHLINKRGLKGKAHSLVSKEIMEEITV